MSAPILAFLPAIAALLTPLTDPATHPTQDAVVELEPFAPLDVFELSWATDPRVSPDGSKVVYVRNRFDVMTDSTRSDLWVLELDHDPMRHRPLVTGPANVSSPRWSPTGDRLLYVTSEGAGSQIFCRWMSDGATAALTHLTEGPGSITWSPDGGLIAFSMFVPSSPEPMAEMPAKPEGAEWAPAPIVVEDLEWRSDGTGILRQGSSHVFVLDAEGGTPWQVTSGDADHGGRIAWEPDGKALVLSVNTDEANHPLDTNLVRFEIAAGGAVTQLTDRYGPDGSPTISPDGQWLAYTGFDDHVQGYQVSRIYVRALDGSSDARVLTPDLDRSAGSPTWLADSSGIVFAYDDKGDTKVARVMLDGRVDVLAEHLGGTSLGRPYGGGSFSVGGDGVIAFTSTGPDGTPADVWIHEPGGDEPSARALTYLNAALLGRRDIGVIEEMWTPSSHDQLPIHAWVVKPPGFDPTQKYPMVLEIHGGPFANYGPRFSAEVQLYAAAGYVTVYANPRGSTSYGQEFGNAIHHAYPGNDYDDLMSVVDAVVAEGFVDEEQLFVTGGSGGGVLTAWIVGKTDRFAAAVVAKPVINWASFVLTADAYPFFSKYWFPGMPWEELEHYWKRSPLSLVGNVTTPTMLLTGEEDWRTPISESEQLYQALKLRGIDTALVRIPGASHGIASRPSRLIAKVAHVLAWFERYRDGAEGDGG